MASLSVIVIFASLMGMCCGEQSLFLRNAEHSATASPKFSVLHAPAYVNFLETSRSLPAREVGSVSAFALGLAPSKGVSWDGLSPGSLFHRPKAAVLFLVDGVKAGDTLDVAAQQSSKMTVESDTVTSQAVHAVAGGKSLAAHVSDLFHGSSLALSMSSDELAAKAAGASGKESVTMFYNHEKRRVQTEPAQSPFTMDLEQMKDSLATIRLPAGFNFDASSGAIVSNGAPVLSMGQKESASFLAELASLQNVVRTLSAERQLVNDNIPDVLTFTISSLKALHVQFGSQSAQVKAAMAVLSAVIPQVASSLSDLYKGDAIIELVEAAFDGEQFLTRAGDISALYDALKPHLHAQTLSSFRASLPAIHISTQASYDAACQDAREAVSMMKAMEVGCKLPEETMKHSGRRLLSVLEVTNITYSGNASTFNLAFERSADWTAAFTMFLIVFLIIALSTLAIAYVLWTMDPGSDSIIYRMTNQRIKTE